ncbi:MAG: hypothetical protein WB762_21935 [Candidatus Sulfotelmatobacter sp.]
MPRAVQHVKLETSGGDVSVQGVGGRVEIQTGGGRVQVDDVGGVVGVETGGQDIDVGSMGQWPVPYRWRQDFRTLFQDIKGTLDALTGGGDIVLGEGMQNRVWNHARVTCAVIFCGGTRKAHVGEAIWF